MIMRHVNLYGKKACPLCDRIEDAVRPTMQRLVERGEVRFEKRNINDDDAWYDQYWDRIPVLTCDGDVLLAGNPDASQIKHAISTLEELTRCPRT